MTEVTKNELSKDSFDHLVLAAPTVDITNIDTSQMKPSDDTEGIKQKVKSSCQNIIKIAQTALQSHNRLKQVTIMNNSPRFDTEADDPLGIKPKLAEFANSYILQLWLDSPLKNKIYIGSHTLECSAQTKLNRYVDPSTGRYDGVHLYSSEGKLAYTESVLNILLSSFQTPAQNSNQQTQQTKMHYESDNHKNCPQTEYMSKKNNKYRVRQKGCSLTHSARTPPAVHHGITIWVDKIEFEEK